MNISIRTALLPFLLLLAACQPVRPTTPETAVAGSAPAATEPLAADPAAAAPIAPETLAESTDAPAVTPALPVDPANAGTTSEQPAVPTLAITSGADVFARIKRSLGPNSCNAGSNSARWRQRYAGHPVVFARRIESILPLLDFVSTEVARAGLPGEFVFIPLVESWYQPAAIGPGGPAGMWQMIGSTARNHGIHIRAGYDGRLSPVESTRAALSYLKTLEGMFNEWQAIVMAYNAGEGRLGRAFARARNRTASGADRRPHGLSNITYDYVAKLQALSCLVSEPSRFGLRLPTETRFEPLVPLLMDPGVDSLDAFAIARGKDAALLRRMNPGFRNGRIVAGVPRLVLAPHGSSDQSPGSVALSSGPVATVQAPEAGEGAGNTDARPAVHTVRAGESLWTIARLYHLPLAQLRRFNQLGGKALVRPGQMLRLVP